MSRHLAQETERATVILGAGRIGRALSMATQGRARMLSGREVLAGAHQDILDRADLIIHAAGPAGEQASCEDPGLAFGMHHQLPERLADWAKADKDRRLILLGSVAPNVKFYGPLKRAGIARATDRMLDAGCANKLLVIEAGHVIGEGLTVATPLAGVVALFVRAAVQGGKLMIGGSGEQTIRYTPLPMLVDLIGAVGRNWPKTRVISPVSEPVRVLDVARLCLRMAALKFNVTTGQLVHTRTGTPPSYEAPTGEVLPVPDLQDVLYQWMRTMEVRLLL